MYFNADQTQGTLSAVAPEKAASPEGQGAQRHLSPKQFPGKPGAPAEAEGAAGAEAGAGAAEGVAAAGGAEAGAAGLAELAPLLLL